MGLTKNTCIYCKIKVPEGPGEMVKHWKEIHPEKYALRLQHLNQGRATRAANIAKRQAEAEATKAEATKAEAIITKATKRVVRHKSEVESGVKTVGVKAKGKLIESRPEDEPIKDIGTKKTAKNTSKMVYVGGRDNGGKRNSNGSQASVDTITIGVPKQGIVQFEFDQEIAQLQHRPIYDAFLLYEDIRVKLDLTDTFSEVLFDGVSLLWDVLLGDGSEPIRGTPVAFGGSPFNGNGHNNHDVDDGDGDGDGGGGETIEDDWDNDDVDIITDYPSDLIPSLSLGDYADSLMRGMAEGVGGGGSPTDDIEDDVESEAEGDDVGDDLDDLYEAGVETEVDSETDDPPDGIDAFIDEVREPHETDEEEEIREIETAMDDDGIPTQFLPSGMLKQCPICGYAGGNELCPRCGVTMLPTISR